MFKRSGPLTTASLIRLVSRRSLATFVSISILVALSTFFIRFGLDFQRQMLKVAAITYDQRILLNFARERVIFLLKNTNKNTPDRLIRDVQVDIKKTMLTLKDNQALLAKLQRKEQGWWYKWVALEEQSTNQSELIEKISNSFANVESRFGLLSSANVDAIKTGFNFLNPKDLAIISNGQYTLELSSLNERVYASALHKNESLSVLHDYLIIIFFLSMSLIWIAILQPMSRTLRGQFLQIQINQDKLEFQATHDSLTGLLNRDKLNTTIEKIQKKTVLESDLAVMAFDLDDFKIINDGYGHSIGDHVLKTIASRIQATMIPGEEQYRMGGDEFLLVFMGFEEKDNIITRTREIVELCSQPIDIAGRRIFARISSGLAFQNTSVESLSELLSAADIALYHVKGEGGNNFAVYSDISGGEITEALSFEKDLVDGLSRDEFEIYYQPIVSTKDKNIVGLEALMRWNHPVKGLLVPDSWLPTARRIGVLSSISLQAIQQVMVDLDRISQYGIESVPISINITRNLLISGKIYEKLVAAPNRSLICIEVPESIVLENNFGIILQQLENIQKLGVSISLDDFGTGYATLSHLTHLPFDTLKIDKQFSKDLLVNHDHQVVIKAIIDLAKGLNKRLICEGVEDYETMKKLLSMSCEYIQGYYYSSPVSFERAVSLLRRDVMNG